MKTENTLLAIKKFDVKKSLEDYIHQVDVLINENERLEFEYNKLKDMCSKPVSIKSKLDHIQDVLNNCLETNDDGKVAKSEYNYEIDLALEELQDIKQAYSFRVEDTRIVNELQELLGNCCVDSIKKRVEELINKESEKQ